jgi:hypothetical protein
MAENTVASLAVRIGADIGPLTKGLNDGKSKLQQFGESAKPVAANIAKIGAAAAVAAAAGLAAMVAKSMAAIDAQAKLAQQLGTTSESMAILDRAGQLSGIGMEKIAAASRALTVRLAQAAEGTGPAVQAIQQLGLSAEALAALPLDQRIATINEAIRQTIPAAQQAAVAARFFGEEAGTAILTMSPETIAQAAEQARQFGTAISDVDAAKIEAANDAFSTTGMLVEGAGKQLAVAFAPIIRQVGEDFAKSAANGEKLRNVAEAIKVATVVAIGAIANMADLLWRPFRLVGETINGFFTGVLAGASAVVRKAIELANKIPGVNLDAAEANMRAFSTAMTATYEGLDKRFAAVFTDPLAGNSFAEWAGKAEAAGTAAAEAAVKARAAVMGNPEEQAQAQVEQNDAKIAEEQRASDEIDSILEEAYQNKLRRDQLTIEAEQRKKEILGNAFSGLSSLMNSESRKMFEIGKAAAIAQSVIATYTGMSEALKLGWPLGPIAAAAIGLQGFNQVAQIRAQQFKGGGGGKAGSNTAAVNAGTQPVGGGQGGQGGPAREVVVSGVTPDSLFSGSQLVELINRAQRDGAVVMRFA